MSRPQALLVPGKPSKEKFENPELLDPSDMHWFPWTKRRLTLAGYHASVLDMPEPFKPKYKPWKEEFERRLPLDERSLLVGHSAGASFLLRWMSENPDVEIDKLVLAAPWLDPEKRYGRFADFTIDPSIKERCLGGCVLFFSSKDDPEAYRSTTMVMGTLTGIKAHDIADYGHFLVGNTMEVPEFPELIAEVLQ